MVPAALRSSLRRRRSAWLLAFALWLPLAQWAAAAHALLHVQASLDLQREAPPQLPAFCDTCLDAIAVGGAAPLPDPPPAIASPAAHATPCFLAATPSDAATAFPYRSRAPPLPHV